MIIIFQNFWFSKEFHACNVCFGLYSKIKKKSGTNFWCTFSGWFFLKNVPYLILYQWTEFQCHTLFLSPDIKQNMLLSSYLDNWWRHKLRFFLNKPLKQCLRGKKEEKTKIQKFEYLENKKSFLDEIKNIFYSFWRAIIWWKIKIW